MGGCWLKETITHSTLFDSTKINVSVALHLSNFHSVIGLYILSYPPSILSLSLSLHICPKNILMLIAATYLSNPNCQRCAHHRNRPFHRRCLLLELSITCHCSSLKLSISCYTYIFLSLFSQICRVHY